MWFVYRISYDIGNHIMKLGISPNYYSELGVPSNQIDPQTPLVLNSAQAGMEGKSSTRT